jgi:MFS family permease
MPRPAGIQAYSSRSGASKQGVAVGLSSAVDTLMFYPAGLVSDRLGRKWSAVSCLLVLSAGMVLVPLTHTFGSFVLVGLLMGAGNGLGSGINMTLGADFAAGVEPSLFLGLWRLVTDVGIAASVAFSTATLVIAGLGIAAGVFHAATVKETLGNR